jgi:hypothetical protein
MKRLAFLNLTGISGQIAALVVASIIAIHLILTATFLVYRPDEASIDRGHTQLVAVVQLLGAAPTAERPRLFADIARAFPQLDIGSLPPGPAAATNESADSELRSLHRRLGSNYRIFSLPHEQDALKAGIALPDGAMISATLLEDQRQRPFWIGPWMTTLLFAAISVTLLGLWTARALTAPLSSFARAAESFSLNGAQRHAGADLDPDRRPYQDAGRHQPRLEDPDHPNAPALRIYRRRCASQLHAERPRSDAIDAGVGAFLPAQRP